MPIYTFDRPTRLAATTTRLERIPHRRRARRSRPERLRGGYVQHWAVQQAVTKGVPHLAVLQDTDNRSAKAVSGMTGIGILATDGDVWDGFADSAGDGLDNRVTCTWRSSEEMWRLSAPTSAVLFDFGETFEVGERVQMIFEKDNGDIWMNTYPYEIKQMDAGTNRMYFDKPLPNSQDFSQVSDGTEGSFVLPAGTLVTVVRIDN